MKKKLGQFYTLNDDINDILSNINVFNYDTILEPSVGDGSFYFGIIDKLLEKYDINHIVENIISVVDIDISNINLIRLKLKTDYGYIGGNAQLYHSDFFQFNMKKYSLIIGNPPYISSNKFPKTYIHNIAKSLGFSSTKENLYIYFLLRCLRYSDNVVFLIPDGWLVKENILSKINCHCDIIQYRDRILFRVNSSIQLFIFDKTKPRNLPVCNLKQEILDKDNHELAISITSNFNHIKTMNQYVNLLSKSSKVGDGNDKLFTLKQNRVGNSNYNSIVTKDRIEETTNTINSKSNLFIKKVVDFLPTMYYHEQSLPFASKYIGLKNLSNYTDLDILASYRSLPSLLHIELYSKEGTNRSLRTKFPGFFGILNDKILNKLPMLMLDEPVQFIHNEYKTYDDLFADNEYMYVQTKLFLKYNIDIDLIPKTIESIYNLSNFRNRKII